MSFLQGGFSAQRFTAPRPTNCDAEDLLASLVNLNFNRTQAGEDGVQVGWGGGDHKYDGGLGCEKNLRGEFLSFAFRVTKFAPRADEVKAQFMIELKGVLDAAGNAVPTAKQKREARESAQAVIEEKGKDGRWDKHTLVPVVWDGTTGQVWLGAASHAHAGRFMAFFTQTFGVDLLPITAGVMGGGDMMTDVEPAFGDAPVWCPDGLDWLGNEFALQLVYDSATGTDSLFGANVVNRLTLACPDGSKGTDTFTVGVPTALPEVVRALQDGRLPRSVGLTVKTGPAEWVYTTLDPEAWVVTGVKLPELEDLPPGQERDVRRLEQCRELFKTLDELYQSFLSVRLGDGWAEVVGRINQWSGRVPAEAL